MFFFVCFLLKPKHVSEGKKGLKSQNNHGKEINKIYPPTISSESPANQPINQQSMHSHQATNQPTNQPTMNFQPIV